MTMRWYIVHAYSNFEKKVAESIREQAAQRGLEGKFEEIMVPKYYVAVSAKGKLALAMHLHHGVRAWVPNSVRQTLKRARLGLQQRTWLRRRAG